MKTVLRKTILISFMLIPLLAKTNSCRAGGNTPGENNVESPVNSLYSPFLIEVDPMERLLLINFEEDPDSIYIGFEPQVFDDTQTGTGMVVIGWRRDGYVDVYHQQGLQLNAPKYAIAGKGLHRMIETYMPHSTFVVEEKGVNACIEFNDLYGRKIELLILEQNNRKRKPFGLLAPVGHSSENPINLPVLLLHDFYFIRKKDTQISITIDGRQHQPDRLPIPLDRQKMYFTRYCPDPVIATVNPSANEVLAPVLPNAAGEYMLRGNRYVIENISGRNCIRALDTQYKEHQVQMRFDPPVPCITTLQKGESLEGRFEIEGEYTTGKITGDYRISELDGSVYITMHPSGGWKPRPDKLSLRFMYSAVKIFKQWPTTYQWNAVVTFDGQNPYMTSSWMRK